MVGTMRFVVFIALLSVCQSQEDSEEKWTLYQSNWTCVDGGPDNAQQSFRKPNVGDHYEECMVFCDDYNYAVYYRPRAECRCYDKCREDCTLCIPTISEAWTQIKPGRALNAPRDYFKYQKFNIKYWFSVRPTSPKIIKLLTNLTILWNAKVTEVQNLAFIIAKGSKLYLHDTYAYEVGFIANVTNFAHAVVHTIEDFSMKDGKLTPWTNIMVDKVQDGIVPADTAFIGYNEEGYDAWAWYTAQLGAKTMAYVHITNAPFHIKDGYTGESGNAAFAHFFPGRAQTFDNSFPGGWVYLPSCNDATSCGNSQFKPYEELIDAARGYEGLVIDRSQDSVDFGAYTQYTKTLVDLIIDWKVDFKFVVFLSPDCPASQLGREQDTLYWICMSPDIPPSESHPLYDDRNGVIGLFPANKTSNKSSAQLVSEWCFETAGIPCPEVMKGVYTAFRLFHTAKQSNQTNLHRVIRSMGTDASPWGPIGCTRTGKNMGFSKPILKQYTYNRTTLEFSWMTFDPKDVAILTSPDEIPTWDDRECAVEGCPDCYDGICEKITGWAWWIIMGSILSILFLSTISFSLGHFGTLWETIGVWSEFMYAVFEIVMCFLAIIAINSVRTSKDETTAIMKFTVSMCCIVDGMGGLVGLVDILYGFTCGAGCIPPWIDYPWGSFLTAVNILGSALLLTSMSGSEVVAMSSMPLLIDVCAGIIESLLFLQSELLAGRMDRWETTLFMDM